MSQPLRYLSGLHGIRAIAAVGVMVSHIITSLHLFGLDNTIAGVDLEGNALGLLLAPYGVTMFFTLSGFLITYLLLREKQQHGFIKVRYFYIRRILRIWPLYFLYLMVALCVALTFHQYIAWHSLPYYLFLLANIPMILHQYLPFLGHYWSLGIEEQFYLLFPLIQFIEVKKWNRVFILLIFVFLILKGIAWYLFKFEQIDIYYRIITVYRMHTLLIGALGAYWYFNKNKIFLAFTTHRLTQILCWVIFIAMIMNQFNLASVIDGDLIAIATVCIIIAQIERKNYLISLENKVLRFLGEISYGIYIIHPLIIFLMAKTWGMFSQATFINYFAVFSSVIGLTILFAWLSFTYFESPFLRQKNKYSSLNT